MIHFMMKCEFNFFLSIYLSIYLLCCVNHFFHYVY